MGFGLNRPVAAAGFSSRDLRARSRWLSPRGASSVSESGLANPRKPEYRRRGDQSESPTRLRGLLKSIIPQQPARSCMWITLRPADHGCSRNAGGSIWKASHFWTFQIELAS